MSANVNDLNLASRAVYAPRVPFGTRMASEALNQGKALAPSAIATNTSGRPMRCRYCGPKLLFGALLTIGANTSIQQPWASEGVNACPCAKNLWVDASSSCHSILNTLPPMPLKTLHLGMPASSSTACTMSRLHVKLLSHISRSARARAPRAVAP